MSLYVDTLRSLESTFGSVADAGPLGHDAALRRDEAEEFPLQALAELGRLGAAELQRPVASGGRFRSFEQLLALSWTLGRRDPSLALTQGMQTWLWLVRMSGDAARQQRCDDILRDNGSPCFAASEALHGADLLASDTLAVKHGDRFEVTGEKWPIGRAGHAACALVLARTRVETGPRSLSWFFVEGDASGWTRLPRVKTVGLRAADLGGLALRRSPAVLLGREGEGLELTLRIFQITRPLVGSLSLGACDTVLRTSVLFALERSLHQQSLAALPVVRRTLAEAWLDLLAAEMLLLSTVRGLHVTPEQTSFTSPLAKATAPELVAASISRATTVLGARAFLREGSAAIVQKMVRDQAAAGLIDGSTPVCLHAVAAQLPALLRENHGRASRLRQRLRLSEDVPVFDPERLSVNARGADDLTADACDEIRSSSAELREALSDLRHDDRFAAATAYARMHTAACCLAFENHNPELPHCTQGLPTLAARRLLDPASLAPADRDRVFEQLVEAVRGERLLSITAAQAGS